VQVPIQNEVVVAFLFGSDFLERWHTNKTDVLLYDLIICFVVSFVLNGFYLRAIPYVKIA
jgi:hypothetical protein